MSRYILVHSAVFVHGASVQVAARRPAFSRQQSTVVPTSSISAEGELQINLKLESRNEVGNAVLQVRGVVGREIFDMAAEVYELAKGTPMPDVIRAVEADPKRLTLSRRFKSYERVHLLKNEALKLEHRTRWEIRHYLGDVDYETYKQKSDLLRKTGQMEALKLHTIDTLKEARQRKTIKQGRTQKQAMLQVATEARVSNKLPSLPMSNADLLAYWRGKRPSGNAGSASLSTPTRLAESGPLPSVPSTSMSAQPATGSSMATSSAQPELRDTRADPLDQPPKKKQLTLRLLGVDIDV